MIKRFTSLVLLFCMFSFLQEMHAQTVITRWDFNSVVADANTATGSIAPSTGAGTIAAIGAATSLFASGDAGTGSSDPATGDDSGWGNTSHPASGNGDKTAGISFASSTAGYTNIIVTYDVRHSNTSSRYSQFQYTTDITATSPVWVDFQLVTATAGDTWFARSFNLSAVTALNNNPNAGFRVVSVFEPSTTVYAPSGATSTYATTGNWRFDMVTVSGTDGTPPITTVSFVGTKTSVSETSTTVNIVANLQGGGASASSIDLEILPLSTATAPGDYTLPVSLQFNWAANANNVNQTISFTINNDALPENAEYFIVRMVNPVNIALPSAASNHFTVTITDDDKQAPAATQSISLSHIASFSNGAAGTNSAEIVAHDPASQRLFIANSIGAKIDIVNFSDPSAANLISSIPVSPYGNINSIAVKNGIVAAAIENTVPELPGKVVFFDINGNFISQVNAGAMPDMITFNNAGTKVLTANEGQPRTDYVVDPEGSVTIVDISGGLAAVTQANVSTAGFNAFNGIKLLLKTAGIRIFGSNNPTVAQDMEPEYITISDDDQTAWVTCQENNAIAIISLATNTVTDIIPLGTKNHALPGNALDISDQGGVVEIASWPVKGVYMPDAVASYKVGGKTYLVTANEGDAREYDAYSEIVRAGSAAYVLDPGAFPYAAALKANIGRLNVTTASGDTDGDGDFDEIHAYGSRSISIWDAATGALVWDSGDQLEMITSKHPVYGSVFNASNANNTLKNRSDDKGPEPEGVTVAVIAGQTYAFIALERIGGCMVYNITDPANPVYVDYKNTRNLLAYGGDNGAEGIIYISAANSPTGVPIVILANEVSSTLSFYSVNLSVLEITLADIKASNIGARNLVTWNTAAEDIRDVFEIERSNNGASFEYLATTRARGAAAAYSYVDALPYEGLNFYRLKLKHSTGRISYSDVVSANVKGAVPSIQVYPNPVKDKLTLRTNSQHLLNTSIDIINMQGMVVKKVLVTSQQTTIDVSSLPAGIYTLRYLNSNGQQTIRITKQ